MLRMSILPVTVLVMRAVRYSLSLAIASLILVAVLLISARGTSADKEELLDLGDFELEVIASGREGELSEHPMTQAMLAELRGE